MPSPSWPRLLAKPAADFNLPASQAHIWQVSLLDFPQIPPEIDCVLSPDERARAGRFRFERDRNTYALARGVLRQLLGGYLGQAANAIRFRYGAQGKPALADSSALHFNVSHSGEIILLAFSTSSEIGVDVEQMRPDADLLGLAEHSFSKKERAAVAALEGERRVELFYEYWSCKEACIKADGRGLSVPLEKFNIENSAQGRQWRNVKTADETVFFSSWQVRILETAPAYAAAVAASGTHWDVARFELHDGPKK